MPTIKKIFFKKISSILGLFIVCGFSLTLGAILLRVVYSAVFQQPTQPPTADPHELGALAEKIGNPTDAAGDNTVFGKIAGVSGGVGGLKTKRVFVTSTSYNGNLGGLAGADTKCQIRADAAGLGGVWKAILSDNNVAARDRIGYDWDVLVTVGGRPVTTKWEIWNGFLANHLNMTEFNNPVGTGNFTWSATGSSGESNNITDVSCQNWTYDGGSQIGTTGDPNVKSQDWMMDMAAPFISPLCSTPLSRLYCIEQ